MELKEKIVEGFAHSYLRTEQKIVVDHLRAGRIDQETWQEHLQELEKITEAYLAGEMKPENFLRRRKQITKEIRNSENTDITGVTREEAVNLYEPVREKHQTVLKEAHEESTSTSKIFYKTVVNKFALTVTQFKHI